MARIFRLIMIIFWLPLINAQYGGGQSSSTTTIPSSTSQSSSSTSQSSSKAVQSVDVGESGFTFSPDTLTVAPGDKVEFHFYPGDHSVVQASFDNPCQPSSDTGIFSGFMTPTNGQSKTVFTLTVNDTNPIWLYCAQIGHCQAGMVAVINPPTGGQNTLTAFKAAAAGVSGSSAPANVQGGILGPPSSASASSSSSSASSSSASGSSSSKTSPSASSSSASTPSTSSPSSSTLSTSASTASSPSSTTTGSSSSSEANALQGRDVTILWVSLLWWQCLCFRPKFR